MSEYYCPGCMGHHAEGECPLVEKLESALAEAKAERNRLWKEIIELRATPVNITKDIGCGSSKKEEGVKLERCPFCGARQDPNEGPWPGKTHLDAPWYVQCRRCYAGGPVQPTQEKAIEHWNKRHRPKGDPAEGERGKE